MHDSARNAQVDLDAEDEAAIRAMLAQRATAVRRLDPAAAPAGPGNSGAAAQPGAAAPRGADDAPGPAPAAARAPAPKQAQVLPRLLAVAVKRKVEANGGGGGGGAEASAAKRPANGEGTGGGPEKGDGGGALLGGLLGGYGSSNSDGSS